MSSSFGCQTAFGAECEPEAAAEQRTETPRSSETGTEGRRGTNGITASRQKNPPTDQTCLLTPGVLEQDSGRYGTVWSPCAQNSCRCDRSAAAMVWSRDRGAERPPLSVILPRLYLGAESDVTQEQLASRGISYVLSVSRCCPQPSFLPGSRYLRIPIDDSLWDDLLPWIPQALHFIDAAMSSGASVLVHCAAGISRSPALAVAYIMYSLGLDLDQAYKFVKERRPSISPNFNFLGQLQHFQGTLSQKAYGGDLLIQPLDNRVSSEGHPVPNSQNANNAADGALSNQKFNHAHKTMQRHSFPDDTGNQQRSISGKLQNLQLNLSPNQQQLHTPCELPAPSRREPVQPVAKPTQLPAGSASLREKRKSLTLCLSSPSPVSSSQRAPGAAGSNTVHRSRTTEARTGSCRAEEIPREQSPSRSRSSRAEVKEQGLLSPLGFTLNKLLGWGEKLLMGGVFVPVRMGRPALPYSC